jgi:hypothetical protein
MKAVFKEIRMRRAGSKVTGLTLPSGLAAASPSDTVEVIPTEADHDAVAGRTKTPKRTLGKKVSSSENPLLRPPEPVCPVPYFGRGGRDLTLPTNNELLQ